MKGEVGSIIVIEVFLSCQLGIEINIIRVGRQLVKLGLVGLVRPFDFPIQSRGARLDVNMLDALVVDMPVKPSLILMPPVVSDRVDPERKLLNHAIHELDSTLCKSSK